MLKLLTVLTTVFLVSLSLTLGSPVPERGGISTQSPAHALDVVPIPPWPFRVNLQSASSVDVAGQDALVKGKVVYFSRGDIDYFTPYHCPSYTVSASLSASRWSPHFEPLVLLSIPPPPEGIVTQQHMKPLVDSYLAEDDVLTAKFFKTVFLHLNGEGPSQLPLEMSAVVYLMREMGTKRLILDPSVYLTCHGPGGCLPAISLINLARPLDKGTAGPYIAHTRSEEEEAEEGFDLFPVFRLYSDVFHTFVMGVYPLNDGSGRYMPLDKSDPEGHKLIPVPSKLYAQGGEADKPLAGFRTAIKDVYDIKGLRTAAGSRAFGEWKGSANETAPSVAILERAGAIIVGKAKTSPFAAHDQAFDDLAPYSPRNDQGQSCAGSSSCPACAIAAYDWLDFTVGTDSGGSIRGPAAAVGLYGNRPSHGLLPMSGVISSLRWSDTAGVLTRSSSMLHKILSTWYADSTANRRHNHLPANILVPSDDLPMMRKDIKELVHKFVQDTEKTFGMKTEMINMTEALPPKDEILSAQQFHDLIYADQWRALGKPFVEAYERSHGGRIPPISGYMHAKWHDAQNQAWDAHRFDEYRKLFENTGDWFNELIGRDEETCSKSIFMEPMILHRLPAYRDQDLTDTRTPLGERYKWVALLTALRVCHPFHGSLSFMADGGIKHQRCPHYVVPIGQVPFQSLVSEKEEMQTVSMSLIAYSGCEASFYIMRRAEADPPLTVVAAATHSYMLLDLISKLNHIGILKDVKTGLTAF
ncbi:hypothetical protein I316_01361 [Kwoniella heveanensis BCC8398]|uniref:Uncharacterized protein n=1 Tax=Kwoniella heveanensis BCC8398 TaxID=1296120 RepID=A0A1B9H0H3_9TREE|nr:hypothetical protein I316_01361 [Kwoniella heveanensis BCC8398]